MEELIRNHPINFYVGKIDFDADGIAKVVCEQSPEAVLAVDCIPDQVKTIKMKFISDVAIVYCVSNNKVASYVVDFILKIIVVLASHIV